MSGPIRSLLNLAWIAPFAHKALQETEQWFLTHFPVPIFRSLILCHPFYAAYFTRERKDRLTVLEILQNTNALRFQLNAETLALLQAEFTIPKKWQQVLARLEEQELGRTELEILLDRWFGDKNRQVRTSIEQAAAIVYYRHQSLVPVIETIVCDDAGQFKLLTKHLSLCWIHAGRHYEKLSPVGEKLFRFLTERFFDAVHRFGSGRRFVDLVQDITMNDEFTLAVGGDHRRVVLLESCIQRLELLLQRFGG